MSKSEMTEVQLSCGCQRAFPHPVPFAGQEVYCTRHQDSAIVVTDTSDHLRTKCRDCNVGRRFGKDAGEARRSASRHALKYNHTVDIKRGQTPIESVGSEGDALPFQQTLDDRADFLREHQASLRRVGTVT